jgi:hypothetical protein
VEDIAHSEIWNDLEGEAEVLSCENADFRGYWLSYRLPKIVGIKRTKETPNKVGKSITHSEPANQDDGLHSVAPTYTQLYSPALPGYEAILGSDSGSECLSVPAVLVNAEGGRTSNLNS